MAAYKGALRRLEGRGVGRAQTTSSSRIEQEETLRKGSALEKASKTIFKKNLVFHISKEETPCRESGLLAKIYIKSFVKAKLWNIVYTSW